MTTYLPDNAIGYNNIAAYYYFKKDLAKSLEYMEKAHHADPRDVLVLMNIGEVSSKLGDRAKATQAYKKILALQPDAETKNAANQKIIELEMIKSH